MISMKKPLFVSLFLFYMHNTWCMNWLAKEADSNACYVVEPCNNEPFYSTTSTTANETEKNSYNSIVVTDVLYLKFTSRSGQNHFIHLPYDLESKSLNFFDTSIKTTLDYVIYTILNAKLDQNFNELSCKPTVTSQNITLIQIDQKNKYIDQTDKYALDIESLDEERKLLLAEFYLKKTSRDTRLIGIAALLNEQTILTDLTSMLQAGVKRSTEELAKSKEQLVKIKEQLKTSLNTKKEDLKNGSIIEQFNRLSSSNIENTIKNDLKSLETLNINDRQQIKQYNSQLKMIEEKIKFIKKETDFQDQLGKAKKRSSQAAWLLSFLSFFKMESQYAFILRWLVKLKIF